MRNHHLRFVLCSNDQIYGGDFAKFCGLLRIYELYFKVKIMCEGHKNLKKNFLLDLMFLSKIQIKEEDFFQIMWPTHNILTLLTLCFHEIFMNLEKKSCENFGTQKWQCFFRKDFNPLCGGHDDNAAFLNLFGENCNFLFFRMHRV